jgi:hypothetical protein
MEVFMGDGGRKWVVVGRIGRVMQKLRYSKRSFEIVSTNSLAVAWSPTRSVLPIHTREHGILESAGWSCGAIVIEYLLSLVESKSVKLRLESRGSLAYSSS